MHLAVDGSLVDRSFLIAVSLTAAVLGFVVLHRSAKLAVSVWIVVLCFVPIWLGIGLGFNGNYYLPPTTAAALLVILALLPVRSFRLSLVDALVLLLVVVGVSSLLTTSPSIALGFVFTLGTYFVVGYVLGRVAPARVDIRWIYGAVGVAFTLVAVLALIEFALQWNPFIQLSANNSMYSIWGTLQLRSGALRAEGAFGHSIALGSSLALAIPLTLSSRFRLWIRACMVLLMLLATIVTFSRVGMLAALLGLILSIVFMRDALTSRLRTVLASTLVALSVLLFPVVATVFNDAGTEASDSVAYRGDLLSLVGSMNIVGVASSARRESTGDVYFGNFRSIDSQLILTGLSSGLVALALVLLTLAVAIVLVIRGRASAATIAIVAQIPALATVALITQYSIFVWFIIGLAASSQLALRTDRRTRLADRAFISPAATNEFGPVTAGRRP
ncbi:MAG: hypothetical protein QOF36_2459 [Microbacteriaceae bacterium]|nr:hypothetical protein [Microbacteriaceae bacterium]